MPGYKVIVCLANSRKYKGRCVAGKEVQAGSFGKWIRPISSAEMGELSEREMTFKNRLMPKLLDIVKVPVLTHWPHSYQTENYLIDGKARWEHKGRAEAADLPGLCDPVDTLWQNEFHSAYGFNDRVPLEIAEKRVQSSLALIRPDNLCLVVARERNGSKVRAQFTVRDTQYKLAVTDPILEWSYIPKGEGVYPIHSRDAYLCVSLGEPFAGFAYKLVAAILNLPPAQG